MTAAPFQTLLIANRGEIALRVMRSAKAMGLRTVAVHSEADSCAPHVAFADEARLIGPPPPPQSYLAIDNIIAAAKATGAEAVHPGYGFLSENPAFAAACAEAGIVFVGPPAHAIDLMGDKAKAKRRMIEAGVPCVPGYQGEDQSDDRLLSEANAIGFPLMVKAAAGGGGRGMRLVETADALPAALSAARGEAQSAFGSGDLILERAIVRPRHVEIQVFADRDGQAIHLAERDCSVQRRHQKVLEEAPSPAVTPALREAMGAAAVTAAREIGYIGAGTVEFLLDEAGAFYFLEMNTRLQVEHPVTEMVTGLDLVAMQLRAARGDSLGLSQDRVRLEGCAIEARLYAEDPSLDFLPSTGRIDLWRPPAGEGVRVDAGVETGGEVSPFYDPMLAKIVAHGPTREEARARLAAALEATALFGVASNRGFLIDALGRKAFIDGAATTAFIAENFSRADLQRPSLDEVAAAVAAVLLFTDARSRAAAKARGIPPALHNWSSATPITAPYRFTDGRSEINLALTPEGPARYAASADDGVVRVEVLSIQSCETVLSVNGTRRRVLFAIAQGDPSRQTIHLGLDGRDVTLTNLNGVRTAAADATGAGAVLAPMHGSLAELLVAKGARVARGDRLAVLEAMKMQHELTAAVDGVVEDIFFEKGAQVSADALLMEITPRENE